MRWMRAEPAAAQLPWAVSDVWKRQFQREVTSHNHRVFSILLVPVALVELFNMLNVLFFSSGLVTLNNCLYFALYTSLFALSAVTLVLIWTRRLRVTSKRLRPLQGLTLFYVLFFCVWSALLSAMDITHRGTVLAYTITLLGSAVLVYLPAWISLTAFLSSQAVMTVCIFLLEKDGSNQIALLINSVVACGMALFISVQQYSGRYRQFCSQKIILMQSHQIRAINRHLQQLAVTDPLSGLYNRRFLEEELQNRWEEACGLGREVAVVMWDIDDFKQFNDRHGHPVGDGCIEAIAGVLQMHVSELDGFAVRYGGEEFLLLLFDQTPEVVLETAESIRKEVEGMHKLLKSGMPAGVTVSAGVCAGRGSAEASIEQYIQAADRALYRAKAEGKNRVVCTQP